MVSMELDEIDRKILRILQENATTPYSEISKEVGISKATVHKRVRRMREEGIIRWTRVIVDPAAVGKKLKAFVGISTAPGSCPRVIDELKKKPEVLEIHEMAGEHDILLKVVVENTDQLNVLLHEIDRIDGVTGSRTCVVLKTEKETTVISL